MGGAASITGRPASSAPSIAWAARSALIRTGSRRDRGLVPPIIQLRPPRRRMRTGNISRSSAPSAASGSAVSPGTSRERKVASNVTGIRICSDSA